MRFISEIIFIVIIAIYSFIITRFVPKKYYSFSNILIAYGALWYGFAIGLSKEQLGLDPTAMIQSLFVGIALSLPVIVTVSFIASHKKLKIYFSSAPSKQYDIRSFCYEILFRIPFGTALSEEIIFRSVLLAILLTNHQSIVAIIVTSILFGLWHIFPTLHTIKNHDPLIAIMEDTRRRSFIALGTTILATTIAGLIFSALTVITGSFIAAWLLHSAINGSAIIAGYVSIWLQRRQANR